MMREKRQMRSVASQFQTREEADELYISGYFSVFNSNYELWEGATESIAETAFDGALADDIRCLINHESRLVLGRTKAGTLVLKRDSRGLWGEVKINPKDQDAMNLYERVKREDVDQCSFGFEILEERTTVDDATGAVHWTILRVKLWEVSVVTFPAYEQTSVSARMNEYTQIKSRQVDAWRAKQKERIKKCLC